MKKMLRLAWLLALVGVVSPAFAVDDPRWTTFSTVRLNTNVSTTTTNVFLLGEFTGADDRIITCTSPNGGLVFFSSTANNTNLNGIGTLVNVATQGVACLSPAGTTNNFQSQFANTKIGAIPILGYAESGNDRLSQMIRLGPQTEWGLFKGRIFILSTNGLGTNFTVNLIELNR